MTVKKGLIFFGISCLIIGVGLAWVLNVKKSNLKGDHCVFCDPTVLKTQAFYEDQLVMGLCSYKPIQPGHCLIMPKRHVERFEDITDEEMLAMMHLMKKVNKAVQKIYGPSAYLILQRNGVEVGQTVNHAVFHYIPKKCGDNKVAAYGLLLRFAWERFQRPLSSELLQQEVKKIKSALDGN